MTTKWIKCPGPGQFRGEGEWVTAQSLHCTDEYFAELQTTKFLPTHEGEAPPDEDKKD